MNPIAPRHQILLGLFLTALMAATRGQHLAVLALPDASLAVFFLAGVWLRPAWTFPALFAASALIDAVAVTWGGVSPFCISPAYVLLVPAYAAPWAAGRWYAEHHRLAWSTLAPLVAAVLASGALAELFSTGGFYLFSGVFPDPTLEGLVMGLLKYLPTSLIHLAFYLGLAALAYLSLALVRGGRTRALTR